MSAIGTFFKDLGSSLASAAQSGISGLVGQAAGGLGNVLFGGISAKRNWKYYKKQANLDHQYNLQTMDHAAQIAKDQYAYEYEMESPEARVKQLHDAGLNKGLAYSGGATGMQGSVSSPAPATSRGSMANMTDSSLAQLASVGSSVRRNDAEANYFNAKAKEALGETPNAVSRKAADDAIASWHNALAGKEKIQADILNLQKDALEREYIFGSTDPDTLEVTVSKIKGVYLQFVQGIEALQTSRYNNAKLDVEARSWYEYFSSQIAEQNANASIANTRAYLDDLNRQIIDWMENEHNHLYSESIRQEIAAKLEHIRRYFAKEFDGSTTELITSWLNGIGSALSMGINVGFKK